MGASLYRIAHDSGYTWCYVYSPNTDINPHTYSIPMHTQNTYPDT